MIHTCLHFFVVTLVMLGSFFSVGMGDVYASNDKKIPPQEASSIEKNLNSTEKNAPIDTLKKSDTTDQETNKLRQDIDTSILSYIIIPKARQLVKDISTKFTEEYPDPRERIEAYNTVKKRLMLRKNRIDTLKMTPNGKEILQEFLDQMIQLLDKKIAELS